MRALSCSPPLPMHGTPCTQNSARHSQHVTLCAPGPRLAPTVPANRAAYPTLNLCTPPPASPIRDRSRTCTETGIKDLRTTKQPMGRTSSTKSLYGRQTPFSNPVWKHSLVVTERCFLNNHQEYDPREQSRGLVLAKSSGQDRNLRYTQSREKSAWAGPKSQASTTIEVGFWPLWMTPLR